MKWYNNLWIGNSILKKKNRIKWRIEHNILCPGIYVITLSSNQKDLFDIIEAGELLQKAYPKKELFIVGLANGFTESVELVAAICNNSLMETGGLDIRSYIMNVEE
ncbi:MAG: hypothetical protein RR364_09175 [Lachnospiraceae bacterium]